MAGASTWGLGAYPDVTLKEARRIATNNRALAKGGFDPRHRNGGALTFAEANEEYLRWRRFPPPRADNRLSNQRYRWDYTMRKHVLPRTRYLRRPTRSRLRGRG